MSEPVDQDCTALGFSGEGRCIEPAAISSFCEEHAKRAGINA